jgi:hypothetical protein
MAKVNRKSDGVGGTDPLVKMDNFINKETMKNVKIQGRKQAGMKKIASGISISPPSYYNPLYTPSALQMPRDRKQINVWCRNFFMTEAIPAAVIELYACLPITSWTIECSNPQIRKEFEDMCKRIKLREVLQGIALEYYMIGDVFIMSELDEQHKTWKNLTILNPDQVEVQRSPFVSEPVIDFIPDDNIKKIIFDRNPPALYNHFRMFLPDVVEAVRAGKPVPIDPAHITHLKHMPTPYGVYGTPLLKRIFKTLMYKEMIRRAQFVIAERYVTPLKIFKLGTIDEPPTQEEIDSMQEELSAVMNDPSLVLVTTQRLTADWQGIAGKTLQLTGEYDFLEREMFAGLGISKAWLDNNGPQYSNSSFGGNAFLQKLENFRETLKDWIEERIFKPICELNDYYDVDPDTDEEFLIKVEFKWDALRLQDEGSRQQALLTLRQQSLLSAKTLLTAYHINAETESISLKEERDTIFDMNRILARQIRITQETQMALQYQMQQLMGGGAPAMLPPMPGQGTPPVAPGQTGSTPPPGGDAVSGAPGMPMGMQMGVLPSGSFAPSDSAGSRPAIASNHNNTYMLKEMLKEVKAALREKND